MTSELLCPAPAPRYDLMSRKFFTHATPTLFNAGTPKPQMSSCFLLKMQDDSIEGIYDTLKQCASISKSAGGIGVAISNVRASGSYIRGTNGHSNGLVPMLRNFNETARQAEGQVSVVRDTCNVEVVPTCETIVGQLAETLGGSRPQSIQVHKIEQKHRKTNERG